MITLLFSMGFFIFGFIVGAVSILWVLSNK